MRIKTNSFVRYFNLVLLCLLFFFTVTNAGAGEITLELAHDTLPITTFYNGTTLQVKGTVPVDSDAVIVVNGKPQDVPLKVKGKVAGILWMNKTDVELEHTPAVYMVYTPENFSLKRETGAGYEALEQKIAIAPESADKQFVFAEYVKLMEKAEVYGIQQGGVRYGAVENGNKSFTAILSIPPKMSAGEYSVTALALRDSQRQSSVTQKLTIVLSGLPKAISSLAFGMPLLFGIMAVFIAVATGLIIGVLFKGGGGAH